MSEPVKISSRSGQRKKRGQRDAFHYPQGVKPDQKNYRISLPELGWISYRDSRQIVGEVKNVTVSQSCGKWYARLQREMSRKVKFSNNWKKAKRKVQNLHSRITNIRRDCLHKVTTTISKNHG